jgi:sulfur-oxidizing protein SoxA
MSARIMKIVTIEVAFFVLVGSLLISPPQAGAEPKSGYEFLQQESKDMQDDDFMNPGMNSVAAGAESFRAVGKNGKSCASCHGENGDGLDTARIAAYPVFDAVLGKPLTLQQQIHICWTDKLKNEPLKYDSAPALELEVFVRNLARGQKVAVQTDGPMQPFWEKGSQIYNTRAGQLDMSCNLCHVNYAGMKIRANTLSQGQSNAFPAYRLENGKINGLHTRFNGCYEQFRASKLEPGSDEYVALEVFVNSRGNGLAIETPGVRY